MVSDTLSRVAFAIQDDKIGLLQARRIAAVALAALQAGDDLGRGLRVAATPSEPLRFRQP
ncbi:hypothetical protein [Aureimonas sp. AU12]|uniref:hypothetical protein n=1 Tax=Aureimonas sp. AU12 TaxID=1638161 RepID=UPI0007829689|nr:hypothetical protein [Aureimonas sp. AU12]